MGSFVLEKVVCVGVKVEEDEVEEAFSEGCTIGTVRLSVGGIVVVLPEVTVLVTIVAFSVNRRST